MSEAPGALERLFQEAQGLCSAGRPGEALALYRRALRLAPDHPQLLGALADAYRLLEAHDKAIATCEQALALAPDQHFARLTLARTLRQTGSLEAAEAAYRILAKALPGDLGVLNELLNLLRDQERHRDALATVAGVLEACPGDPQLHFARGYLHNDLMELEEAVLDYDRALALDPPASLRDRIRWNRGLARLLLGHLDEDAWEARELRSTLSGLPARTFPVPAWDGSPLEGRTLLLHGTGEGFGDTIMGLHYAGKIRQAGGRVLVESRSELLEVVRTCPDCDEAFALGGPLPPASCSAHLMSLPRLFRTRLETIPWPGPYLFVPPPGRIRHRDRLAALTAPEPGRLRVGLVHAGLTTQLPEAQARLDPALLSLLAPCADRVRFFCLQHPPCEPLPPELEATDLGGLLGDFSDTAWALSRLDLLVSVDTAVLHLAGAMGLPAAGLIGFIPDWRWLASGSRSPWYPSLRLYRQAGRRDWAPTLRTLAADLEAMLASGATPADLVKGLPRP